ncbi:LytTR family DNA-binding domain-containing protein [Streptococcus devriesei]|uniref:LytTR family DNA-binding domain-containing protein n=1 Tax=Streptococcus devriesei TaxID=231233 RepID=UPI00056CAF71|nr:LytTR family DNA-binding domain-containing protein [Streptococcus devriesei]
MEIHLNSKHQSVEVFSEKEIFFLNITDIIFIEINNRKTYVHTVNRVYQSRLNLRDFMELLPDYFQQIGKSQIANSLEISAINKSFSSTPKISFRNSAKTTWVSRKYYKELLMKKRSLL